MLLPVETAKELLRYTEWADACMWNAVLGSHAAERDETIRSYLLHLHTVQQAFLAMWTGAPMEAVLKTRPADFASVAALRDWARPYYDAAQRFVGAADEAAFSRPLVMPWAPRHEPRLGTPSSTPTLGETVFQVVNHTTHHRGQVLVRLRALGVEPPLADYIAWVWFGRPAAIWDTPAVAST